MIASSPEARAWARRLAAELPPFTAEEAADLGRLAAKLDARRREQSTAAKAA